MIAISIALAINKQVVIGVIYNPVLDLLYSAVRGKGAFKNGRPIKCSGQTGTTNIFCTFSNLYLVDRSGIISSSW
jgi:fructose-1,6-bisphosphatase/inositol monophosphatase family enzyme